MTGDARDATGQRQGWSLTDTHASAPTRTTTTATAVDATTAAGTPRLRAMSDRSIALARTLRALVVTVALRLPYLLRFTPQGEDIASLLYASRFGDPSPIRWLTEGTPATTTSSIPG